MSHHEEGVYCTYCATLEDQEEEFNPRREYTLTAIASALLASAVVADFIIKNLLVAYTLYIGTMIVAGRAIIPKGFKGLLRVHLDINFLMTFAALASLIIGAPAEGATVLLLFSVAELLEDIANQRVRRELDAVISLRPHVATVIRDGRRYIVPVEEVAVGEIVAVRPGERISVDGVVVEGTTYVDESAITGESVPVPKQPGERVYAGTVNQAGYIEIKTTKSADESVVARIVSLVEEAQRHKSRTETTVARISHKYTPLVVAGSILLALFNFALGATPAQAVYRGLTLLVAGCPCAFAIAIPVSMVSSITGYAREGVLVKGSRHVETMARTEVVALDKTGTLTEGALSVSNICIHSDATPEEVLATAASLEQKSEHPIAQAILRKAEEKGVAISDVSDFQVVPGMGVAGTIRGVEYGAGNLRLIKQERVALQMPEDHECGDGSLVYVYRGDHHLGTIVLSDTERSDSPDVIAELKEMGIRVVMLTGDNRKTAEIVAERLGIDDVHAELLPEDKVNIVKKISQDHVVMMVGDGINDAPALAMADVSVAVAAATNDAAIEAADVALMRGDISLLPRMIQKARRTMGVIRHNVAIAIGAKAFVGLMAVFGLAPLWFAVAVGDMGVSFVVIANALRLAKRT